MEVQIKGEDVILSIVSLLLIMYICYQLGKQCNNHKHNKKMKYTCGVEGGCEQSIHGTYNTKEECDADCGM